MPIVPGEVMRDPHSGATSIEILISPEKPGVFAIPYLGNRILVGSRAVLLGERIDEAGFESDALEAGEQNLGPVLLASRTPSLYYVLSGVTISFQNPVYGKPSAVVSETPLAGYHEGGLSVDGPLPMREFAHGDQALYGCQQELDYLARLARAASI